MIGGWLLMTVVVAVMMIGVCFRSRLSNILVIIVTSSAAFNTTAIKSGNHKAQIEEHQGVRDGPFQY